MGEVVADMLGDDALGENGEPSTAPEQDASVKAGPPAVGTLAECMVTICRPGRPVCIASAGFEQDTTNKLHRPAA